MRRNLALLVAVATLHGAAAAQPQVPGMSTVEYGSFPGVPSYGPWGLSLSPDGSLFSGATNNDTSVHIRRIPPGGGASVVYSSTEVFDADGTFFDVAGVFSGTPNSLLLTVAAPGSGQVLQVLPDGTVESVVGPLSLLDNIADLAIDSQAKVYGAVFTFQRIVRFNGLSPETWIDLPSGASPWRIACDPQDRLWVTATDQNIRRFAVDGTIDQTYALGASPRGIAWAGCGTLAGAAYTVLGDDLVQLNEDGSSETAGTGFEGVFSIIFDDHGSLFTANRTTGEVFRLSGEIACACGPADLAEPFGLLDLADVTAFTEGFLAENPLADLDGDGLFALADINLFVNAFTGGCP